MALTPSEKRFIQRALNANAPVPFITQHMYTCRQLSEITGNIVHPDMNALDELNNEVQEFILGTKEGR